MPIGCHGLVFTGTFDARGLSEAVRRTRDAGFDLLEIPLLVSPRFRRRGGEESSRGVRPPAHREHGAARGRRHQHRRRRRGGPRTGRPGTCPGNPRRPRLRAPVRCALRTAQEVSRPGHASRTTCQPGRHRPHRPAGRSPRYHRLARGGQPVRTEPLQHGRRGTGVHRADRRELPQGAPRQLPHEHRGVGHVPARPRSRARRTPRVRPHR